MSVVLTKDSIPGTMHSRGGFPVKTVIYALFILSLVYMFYIYSSSQSSLREAEMTGARYKREAEERVTEIQELVRAKDRSQESCQNEKSELHNRIKSLNQQYSMVQSQYKETEADFIKLRQDVDTMKLEHAQADSAHAAEYEKLKQEKENDIAKLKDDVADLTRQNQNLDSTVLSLRQKVQEHEVMQQAIQAQYDSKEQSYVSLQNSYRQLSDQNTQLQQKLQQQLPNKALGQQQEDKPLLAENNPKQSEAEHQGLPADTNKILQPNLDLGVGEVNKPVQEQPSLHTEAIQGGHVGPVADNINALHQMRPPNNNINLDIDDSKKGYKDVNIHDINPNDEQKVQILGPALDTHDKHPGGGEVDVVNMNVKADEDDREKNDRDDVAGNVHHNNPLALGQIAVPRDAKDLQDPDGHNKKNDDQQMPPLINEENDQKEQDRGENHYFGEDEEAQQQQQEEEQQQQHQQQEDERQRMEEDERDEGDEGEHHVDRFRDDIGDKSVRRAINPVEPGRL